jgi:hypothetical protein
MAKKQPITDPDPAVIAEIGRITIAWGRLEYVMKLAIKRCLGRPFSEGMLHAEKRRQFSELLKELRGQFAQQTLDKETRALLDKVLAQIEDLNEKRQDIIHSSWTVSPEGHPRMWRSNMEKDAAGMWALASTIIDTDLNWLCALTNEIDTCWKILNQFRPETDAATTL